MLALSILLAAPIQDREAVAHPFVPEDALFAIHISDVQSVKKNDWYDACFGLLAPVVNEELEGMGMPPLVEWVDDVQQAAGFISSDLDSIAFVVDCGEDGPIARALIMLEGMIRSEAGDPLESAGGVTSYDVAELGMDMPDGEFASQAAFIANGTRRGLVVTQGDYAGRMAAAGVSGTLGSSSIFDGSKEAQPKAQLRMAMDVIGLLEFADEDPEALEMIETLLGGEVVVSGGLLLGEGSAIQGAGQISFDADSPAAEFMDLFGGSIDSSYLGWVPEDTIMSSVSRMDIGGLIELVFGYIAEMEGGPEESMDEILDGFYEMTGVDLFEDLLDPLSGDVVQYFGGDFAALIDESAMEDGELPFSMGVVLGLDDSAVFQDAILTILEVTGGSEYVEVEDTADGITITSPMIPLDMAIVITGDAMAFAMGADAVDHTMAVAAGLESKSVLDDEGMRAALAEHGECDQLSIFDLSFLEDFSEVIEDEMGEEFGFADALSKIEVREFLFAGYVHSDRLLIVLDHK